LPNQKGRVGKTTTAINFAASLAYMGHKCLLIDMDPQSNTTSGFGVNKNDLEKSIYNVLINEIALENILQCHCYGSS
jgi:chromosome partitioning protein